MDPFIGFIGLWAPNFAPRGWAFCHGQLIAISSNTALFSLIGTAYGGDGRVTFALPDFQGRVPVGEGTGPGLTTRVLGARGGAETHTLTTGQMPTHNHGTSRVTVSVTISANSGAGIKTTPEAGDSIAGLVVPRTTGIALYNTGAPDTELNGGAGSLSGSVDFSGGDQPFSLMQPYQVVNYIIAEQGIFPSRN